MDFLILPSSISTIHHGWPVDSPHKGTVTLKCFHLFTSSWNGIIILRPPCSLPTSPDWHRCTSARIRCHAIIIFLLIIMFATKTKYTVHSFKYYTYPTLVKWVCRVFLLVLDMVRCEQAQENDRKWKNICNMIVYIVPNYVKFLNSGYTSHRMNSMMTSSNGNIFRVTGHLCEEFTGPRWIPHTMASDAEL